MFLFKIGLFMIICGVIGADEDTLEIKENPEIQPDYQQEWRMVEHFSPQSDSSGWLPHEVNSNEEIIPKRRRLRKRKRRPLLDSDQVPIRRRIRPFSQLREPWEEYSEENIQKPYKRRRIPPQYNQEENVSEYATERNKVRDSLTSSSIEEIESVTTKLIEDSNVPNLKALLKQTGSLSLSEILQQKNLSLTELLKGNQHAISALTERSDTMSTEEISQITTTEKYKRLPPSMVLNKLNKNRHQQEPHPDGLTSRETLEAQRKRLSLLHSHKENKLLADVTKFDVVTEHTTEKRIFVPSNPKYTTVKYHQPQYSEEEATSEYEDRGEEEDEEEVTTPLTTTTTTISTTTTPRTTLKPEIKINFSIRPFQTKAKPKFKPGLPITSAKLSKFSLKTTTTTTTTTMPPPIKIDVGEILNSLRKNKTDEPFRMTIDLEPNESVETTEKLKHVTAKEEIMELLKDPIGRENLSKILKTRNMTIKELVEQRERGSSQLHLADIFHNNTREPEPEDEPFVGTIIPDDVIYRQPKQVTQKPEIVTITSFPTYKIETDKVQPQPFLPLWKDLYPNFFPAFSQNSDQETTTTTPSSEENLQRLEVIDNQLLDSTNNRLNINLRSNEEEEEEFITLPSGVKSAIIASLLIIGLSLLVFITILVIFKWNQKQKQRLNYSGSFSGSKIKSPILETVQRRSLKTLMTETLGRKKNLYKTHLQNMQDNIWDIEKKHHYHM